MITTHLIGGLGNQMFQYAAALGLAAHHNTEVLLDISGFEKYPLRSYLLDKFNVPQNLATPQTPPSSQYDVKHKVLRKLDHIFGTKLCLNTTKGIYEEPYYHFDETFFNLEAPIKLYGYYQSPLYFEGAEDTLRDHFSLREPMSDISLKIKAEIELIKTPVSFHVRRGDYVSNKAANATHGTAGKEYYEKAVHLMRALYGDDIHLVMFSDDPDFVEENMDFGIPRTIIRGADDKPYEDMHLMACCKHHIIANSSFSWWGAWLNTAPNKQVIAPRQWFAPHMLRQNNVTDLYPRNWILL